MATSRILLSVPAADIPLWLLERRRLSKDWAKKLKAIQTKSSQTLEQILSKPELSSVKPFIDSRNKSHFSLKDWEQLEKMLIESSEGKDKNFLGQYASQIIKDTRFIISALKKDNLFLADIGNEITDRIQFEMYFYRK